MKSLYFAHPVNVYNTPLESKIIEALSLVFPESEDWNIENPNQPHHQEGYKKWKKEKGNGMLYYFEDILPKMAAGIGLVFPDGMFGKGVAGELDFLIASGKPCWEMNHFGAILPLITVPQERILSVEETKQRVYVDGDFSKGIKPYL
jgi:hypothetical protein